MQLLPREHLIKTSPVDHAEWNYDGILGFVSRQRFALVESLLPERIGELLEIGYGSGIFLPTLMRRADRVYGVDVHEHVAPATDVLARNGVTATLVRGSAEALPFDDASFDAAVVVSTFEFVSDLERAARELARVLRPDGCAIVVTPSDHPVLDVLLRIATGESAKRDFGERRRSIVSTLGTILEIDRVESFPKFSPIPIYRALRLKRRSASSRDAASKSRSDRVSATR